MKCFFHFNKTLETKGYASFSEFEAYNSVVCFVVVIICYLGQRPFDRYSSKLIIKRS